MQYSFCCVYRQLLFCLSTDQGVLLTRTMQWNVCVVRFTPGMQWELTRALYRRCDAAKKCECGLCPEHAVFGQVLRSGYDKQCTRLHCVANTACSWAKQVLSIKTLQHCQHICYICHAFVVAVMCSTQRQCYDEVPV